MPELSWAVWHDPAPALSEGESARRGRSAIRARLRRIRRHSRASRDRSPGRRPVHRPHRTHYRPVHRWHRTRWRARACAGLGLLPRQGYSTVNYVFGPVPSRRLGQSLGIDTIPLKTCNWNCVYCQLGRTRPVTHTRKEYFARTEILAEVQRALAAHEPGQIDWVTFVGSGEPTLHEGIGWLIEQVKALTTIPVAVITNGSFLYDPEVRQGLAVADAVLPTLDA